MRDDADFVAYVEARWPTIVRALVLLGDSVEEAAGVAQQGLAACYRRWGRIQGADDMDVEVYAEVLEARGRLRRADHAVVPAPAPVAGTAPADVVLVLEGLLGALARLDEDERTAVVLQHAAGLAPDRAADVLGIDPSELERRVASALASLDLEGLQRCP